MKQFRMVDSTIGTCKEFDERSAPDWLTSKNTVKGSTMDMRWFWEGHVLSLGVGESVDTDFQKITRIKDE